MSTHQKSSKLEDVEMERLFAMIGPRFKRMWMVNDGTFYAESVCHVIVEADSPRDALSELLYNLQKNEHFEKTLPKKLIHDV